MAQCLPPSAAFASWCAIPSSRWPASPSHRRSSGSTGSRGTGATLRRLGDDSGFPWLSASRFPELVLYQPIGVEESTGEPLPTHVRSPQGRELEICGADLVREIAGRSGHRLELMKLRNGIFDDAPVSVITLATLAGISRAVGTDLDRRRFRANVLLEAEDPEPFREDGWVGRTLIFGEGETGPAVTVTARDVRCMMINLDPDTGEQDGRVMKAVVGLNANHAEVYGAVVRPGTVSVGQCVRLARYPISPPGGAVGSV
jgi:hypothetical protein